MAILKLLKRPKTAESPSLSSLLATDTEDVLEKTTETIKRLSPKKNIRPETLLKNTLVNLRFLELALNKVFGLKGKYDFYSGEIDKIPPAGEVAVEGLSAYVELKIKRRKRDLGK